MASASLPSRALLLALAVVACNSGGDSGPSSTTLSGTVLDYFTGTPLASVQLGVDGSGAIATSSGTGAYELTGVPTRSTVTVVGSLANYRPTRSERLRIQRSPVTADLAMVAGADHDRQYTAVSVPPSGSGAMVIAELSDDAGQPRVGLPLADITLVDTASVPVGTGPFVFGAAGDLDPALTTTAAFGNRSRIAFLNVPAGINTLRVTVSNPSPATLSVPVVTSLGSVTLARR
jgi:hypothetical protein